MEMRGTATRGSTHPTATLQLHPANYSTLAHDGAAAHALTSSCAYA
ncbi:hypothetical protein [Aneurinibacillus tyrosinisolvens]|nr:hypothetical protein [Aneurinibacillus tyrosinisolvens]